MSLPTAVAVRHVAFEDLGLLDPLLQRLGFNVSTLDAGVDSLDEAKHADLLVVLGAPIGVHEDHAYPFLAEEARIVENRLGRDAPVLGICLGAQLLARVLGADVATGSEKEIGFARLQLTPTGRSSMLAPLAEADAHTIPVLHWHGDVAELPRGATCLASTPACANQAFEHGRSLGLQFHLEAEPEAFERWLIGHAIEIASTPGVDVSALRRAAAKHGPELRRRGRASLHRWLTQLWPELSHG